MRRPGQVTLTTPGENTTKVIVLPTFCNYFSQEKKKYFLSFHVDSSISDICLIAIVGLRLLVRVSNRPEENIVIVKPTMQCIYAEEKVNLKKLISLIVKMMMTISEKETR